ncbi:acyl-CoA thioesterase [Spiromyces aspiralis]|uniref:Acyl-CoA thioesterase n=1 Tax=Spiromyces aspiralis TaxID=68401 RepID=A0ACC1HSF9_9FUNG|nr:acyl-CoA thioesterase [Spiromyces aspiralis]
MSTTYRGEKLAAVVESALDLEQIDPHLYRSKKLWQPSGNRGVFGGHIISQATIAAAKTLPPAYQLHSLHSYFIMAAQAELPILYQVEATRSGRSFATRTVFARQSGKCIFTLICSFQIPESSPISHQIAMPDVPLPDKPSRKKQDSVIKLQQGPTRNISRDDFVPLPIDIIPVRQTPSPPKDDGSIIANRLAWIRVNGDLNGIDAIYHQALVIFCSDFMLAGTSLLPYNTALVVAAQGERQQESVLDNKECSLQFGEEATRIQDIAKKFKYMVSLDHSIWFHSSCRADEWLLYEMETTWGKNGRALIIGRLYSSVDRRLVASVSQEALIRFHDIDYDSNTMPAMTFRHMPPQFVGFYSHSNLSHNEEEPAQRQKSKL